MLFKGAGGGETYQVIRHCVDIGGNFLPPALQASNIGLSSHDTIDTDILGDSLHLITENGESVNHVVDSLLEYEYLSLGFNFNLAAHITIGNGLCDGRDPTDLEKVSKQCMPQRIIRSSLPEM